MPIAAKQSRSDKKTRRPTHPKHAQIATRLSAQIRNGRYQPGDLLPSEPELCRRYGVSRHTVRTALRSLYEKGLIVSQQGRGSVVLATALEPRYTFACDSIADLTQYAAATSRRLVHSERITLEPPLARWLGCAPGSVWWRVRTCRQTESGGKVMASSVIYVPDAFAAAVRDLASSPLPLFTLMQERYGHAIAQVRQNFSVTAANAEEAADLELEPGAPLMCVERRFFDERGGLLEVSHSVHPPEAFHYEMTVRQVLART